MNPLNHVAIIMDGNGRWGLLKKKSRNYGHRAGVNVLKDIIDECIKCNIKHLSLYAFSSENWKRPKKEINYLFRLLENFLKKNLSDLNKRNIRIKFMGEKSVFSKSLKIKLDNSELITKNNDRLQINLAINYVFKNELIHSIKKKIKQKKKINEKNLRSNFYVKNISDPELLIRTGNTNRLSNFLLWQLAYSEIFFLKKLWPDFTTNDFRKIIKKYYKIKRNFGAI